MLVENANTNSQGGELCNIKVGGVFIFIFSCCENYIFLAASANGVEAIDLILVVVSPFVRCVCRHYILVHEAVAGWAEPADGRMDDERR